MFVSAVSLVDAFYFEFFHSCLIVCLVFSLFALPEFVLRHLMQVGRVRRSAEMQWIDSRELFVRRSCPRLSYIHTISSRCRME